MQGECFMLKKKLLGLFAGLFATGMCFANVDNTHAASRAWDVHAQPGNYETVKIVDIVNHGTGYIASCDSMNGDAASKKTNILEFSDRGCSNNVSLNNIVEFTSTGKTIAFKHKSMPKVDVVYMKVSLTYSNGKTASMSGTIQTN